MPERPKGIMELFDTRVAVFGAPGRYIQGRGAIHLVGDCAATIGARAVLVVDAQIRHLVAGLIGESCKLASVEITVLPFEGELTRQTGADLRRLLTADPTLVIAAGGGRAIDAGKALASLSDCGLITVPTVASNDAPTSKNFVLYDERHRLVEVGHLLRNPDFVVVDTELLISAPKNLFRAGLGDALAKKFEADACMARGGTTLFMARPTRLAQAIASHCYDTLISAAPGAWRSLDAKTVTEDFDAAVEAMILMAGLGFESGGLSLPHAMTRGIPVLPGADVVAHGLQVAWALMVHFEVLGVEPPSELVELYRLTGLPLSLADLGLSEQTDEALAELAEATVGARHVHNLPFSLQPSALTAAIRRVEERETNRRKSA